MMAARQQAAELEGLGLELAQQAAPFLLLGARQ
jgi:hypothetical protein